MFQFNGHEKRTRTKDFMLILFYLQSYIFEMNLETEETFVRLVRLRKEKKFRAVIFLDRFCIEVVYFIVGNAGLNSFKGRT